ncbi:FkbM family methyltransferase [Salinispora arenicola]|uniref:FkbM family methyltransferase n=1 Tax=Salinispora arenicola TaxID=168697 RepID=A0A542XM63_SALAC|nr:FkbM family methyltransferase [Salinispora arenicola]TQL36929.1 FkbM family methyltransferase [Salinispora arenicola]GIM87121.1 hypothetical protein Sar04_38570 [Salinispora arenicola]
MATLVQQLASALPEERRERLLTIFDIGCEGGVPKAWRQSSPYATVVGFEPDPRAFEQLAISPAIQQYPVALADSARSLTLNITRGVDKSSILRPNMDLLTRFPNSGRYEVVDELHLPPSAVSTVDAIASDHGIGSVDFLKVDVQGAEDLVLRGARAALRESVLGLQIEVEFLEIYKDQPLFGDIDRIIRSAGFELMDLDRVYWKRAEHSHFEGRGQLAYADALYLRNLDQAMTQIQRDSDPVRRVIGLAIVACTYGLHDYAAAALGSYCSLGLQNSAIARDALQTILDHDCVTGSWADYDRRLGNVAN